MPSRNGDFADSLGGDGSTGEIQVLSFAHQGKDKVVNVQIALGELLNILSRQLLNALDLRFPVALGKSKKFPIDEQFRHLLICFGAAGETTFVITLHVG